MAKKKTSSKKKAAKKATKKKAAKKSTRKSAKKSSGKKTARKSAKKSAKKSAAGKSSARKSSGKPRKTAARKAREAGKVKKNAGLTSKQLKKFRDLLLSKRATLLGDVTSMTNEALGKNRQDAGDLSNMPIHMADIGSDNYEQEFTLGLLESERQMLRDIDHAIERMAEGTYGICLGTGEPIAKLRLEAKPWAKFSIEYARLVERGQAPEISGDEDGEPDEDSDDDWDEDDE